MREIASLREAAEADRRSLLIRLGRKEIGDTIVGAESGLRSVMDRVELVAPSDAPVLIFGETGTGKELVARAIHNRSRRASGPFDRVNCGAIPPELIDSQLFGHERGAFTGAVEGRRGWFERADGGTLFLDEIGELPLPAQVRMLRILQDGWMERVGGEQSIHVNVRIVAATHRDLAAMVAEGRFREDLWYRIAVFPIVLPTLRERREDIPQLVEHFAARAATRFGLAPVKPTPDDLELLADYLLARQHPRIGDGDRPGRDSGRRQITGSRQGAGRGHESLDAASRTGKSQVTGSICGSLDGYRTAKHRSSPASGSGAHRGQRTHRRPVRRGEDAARSIRTRSVRKCGNWKSTGRNSAPTVTDSEGKHVGVVFRILHDWRFAVLDLWSIFGLWPWFFDLGGVLSFGQRTLKRDILGCRFFPLARWGSPLGYLFLNTFHFFHDRGWVLNL